MRSSPGSWRSRLPKWLSVELLIGVFGVCGIHLTLAPRAFRDGEFDRVAAGQFGDFVGGYIGTLLALASVLLLVRTLNTQRLTAARERFVGHYFTLIDLHRRNVDEIKLAKDSGRKVFVLLLREFREMRKVVDGIVTTTGLSLTLGQRCHLAYYGLLYGVGLNSTRVLTEALDRGNVGCAWWSDEQSRRFFLDSLTARLRTRIKRKHGLNMDAFGYILFEGHQSRLGHYYRHLFQAVQFVDSQPDLDDVQKYDYVKMLRAQLSTHEQALLLINSLSPVGEVWRTSGFLQDYRLVANLPRDFFDPNTEIDVTEVVGPCYFEWEEDSSAAVRRPRTIPRRTCPEAVVPSAGVSETTSASP